MQSSASSVASIDAELKAHFAVLPQFDGAWQSRTDRVRVGARRNILFHLKFYQNHEHQAYTQSISGRKHKLNILTTNQNDVNRITSLLIIKLLKAKQDQNATLNQNVTFIHSITIERCRIPIRNEKAYCDNVIHTFLCYSERFIRLRAEISPPLTWQPM